MKLPEYYPKPLKRKDWIISLLLFPALIIILILMNYFFIKNLIIGFLFFIILILLLINVPSVKWLIKRRMAYHKESPILRWIILFIVIICFIILFVVIMLSWDKVSEDLISIGNRIVMVLLR